MTSAQTALAGATLTSPINGVVASVGLTVGQSVSGSGSSGGGTGGSAHRLELDLDDHLDAARSR